MKNVAVIGGAGHVGLPFSIVLANSGHFNVVGIDLDSEKCHRLNGGEMIYEEVGGHKGLNSALATDRLTFSCDGNDAYLEDSDVIAIMIGTPVDSENNPRLDDLFDYVDKKLIPVLTKRFYADKETLVLLRSTVSPGTTERVRNRVISALFNHNHLQFHAKSISGQYDKLVHIVFAPERVAQGYGLVETQKFPQIIGANTRDAWFAAQSFFHKFTLEEPILLETVEAELAKLITNMTRYVNFALANEFYMIGTTFSERFKTSVNMDKIIDACNKNYPRMNLPKPGPNVGGPCLFKDGRFLTTGVPYADLINTSFLINEGFPAFIMDKIRKRIESDGNYFHVETIGILGATFKKDNDDIRNSLSFKMAKICRESGPNVLMHDPFWRDNDPRNVSFDKVLGTSNVIIIMTPHTPFVEKLNKRLSDHIPAGTVLQRTLIVDVWKCLDLSKKTDDGIFYGVYKQNG
jgi:UDP-N-acetyl-D-mannosaminuronic acid dehydrogenase